MTEGNAGNDSWVAVDRRTFITTASVAVSGPLAGCSAGTKRRTPERENEHTGAPDRGNHDETTRVESKIRRVYDLIEDVTLVEEGEFVYDLERSSGNVDYNELIEIAGEAMEAAEGLDEDVDAAKKTREHLRQTARIAFLLVDQRYLVHNVLLGGTVFRRSFTEGKYTRAVEVIGESRQLLDRLNSNRDKLEEEIAAYQDTDLTMDEVYVRSVSGDLAILIEVFGWTVPTFEAFEYTARGMALVQEGNQGLNKERYGIARDRYDAAQQYFSRAETAFDTAHGRGRTLEYLVPLVNDLRCFLPSLVAGYDDLDQAFIELEAGNEEQGMEIARETMHRMHEEFRRCM